jgi:hypothetical protein
MLVLTGEQSRYCNGNNGYDTISVMMAMASGFRLDAIVVEIVLMDECAHRPIPSSR